MTDQPPLFDQPPDPDDLGMRDNWSGPAARRDDPAESHEAAANVEMGRDRLRVLKVYAVAPSPMTYRQASLTVDPDADYSRVESLRRRGSDLKKRGLIAQVGRDGRQGTFAITDAGRLAVPAR